MTIARTLSIAGICALMAALSAAAADIYVSPFGSDGAQGTQSKPLATLEEALVRVKTDGGAGSRIVLMDGIHSVTDTLEIQALHSGTAAQPLQIVAASGAKPRVIGGRVLDNTRFRKVNSGDAAYNRLPSSARSSVYVYQLDGVAREGASKTRVRGTANRAFSPVEVFNGSTALDLARWPDRDTWNSGALIENGFYADADHVGGTAIVAPGAPTSRWQGVSGAWVHGYFSNDWADNHLPVSSVDGSGRITLGATPSYGWGSNRAFHIYNLPEELSKPGEYWIDSGTGLLYIWPLHSIGSQPIYVSELTEAIIRMRDAQHIVFSGIIFEASRWQLIEAKAVSGITFQLCTFRNNGADAVEIEGTENVLHACEFYEVGGGALRIGGGERTRLVRANNTVTDCYFHDTGRHYLHGSLAVNVWGTGNTFRNNLVVRVPASAVQFSGNLNVIADNDILDTCYYSDDQGAIYTGRDFAGWGNEVTGNLVRHTRTLRKNCKAVHAIYIDDFASGTLVRGNTVYDCNRVGLNTGGGRSNIFENNVVAVTDDVAHMNDNRALKWKSGDPGHTWNILEQYQKAGVWDEPWRTLFPELAATPNDWLLLFNTFWLCPRDSVFARNVLWGNIHVSWESNWSGLPNSVFGTYREFGPNAANHTPLFNAQQLQRRATRPTASTNALQGFTPIDLRRSGPQIDYTAVSGSDVTFAAGSFLAAMANTSVPTPVHGTKGYTPGAPLTVEYFFDVAGDSVSALSAVLGDGPDRTVDVEEVRVPTTNIPQLGARIRGYIVPSKSGSYNFYVSGDDSTQFSLSTNSDPASARVVASNPAWVPLGNWNRYSQQKSAAINLNAGQWYYFEFLMKQGWGADFGEVQWSGPGFDQRPIVMESLRPYGNSSSSGGSSGDSGEPVDLPLGSISLFRYDNLPGDDVSDLTSSPNYPNKPSKVTLLTSFETPVDAGNQMGMSARGYLVAPVTGNYRFWIACDDSGSLRLSTNYQPSNAREIASVPGWVRPGNWDAYASQGSAPVYLTAGEIYYIEALAKEGWGGDHLAVAWSGPGWSRQIIDGDYLAPAVVQTGSGSGQTGGGTQPPQVNTGHAEMAVYTGLKGEAITALTGAASYPENPAQTGTLTSLELRFDGDQAGVLVAGYIVPPSSGNYTFWIAADDSGEFWLSTDHNAASLRKLAYNTSYTLSRQYDRYASQKSVQVTLEAGKPYYFQALMKEGWGGSHLSVAWEGPGIQRVEIPGSALAPAVAPWE